MIDPGYCESVAVADFNNDGKLDILSGEYWFEAPSWTAHKIRDINFTSGYMDNFSDLALDVDADGYTDVVQIAYFARRIVWLKNPGKSRNASPGPRLTHRRLPISTATDKSSWSRASGTTHATPRRTPPSESRLASTGMSSVPLHRRQVPCPRRSPPS